MAHPFFALLLIVGLTPGAALAEAVGPQVNRVAHKFIAGPSYFGLVNLARLIVDRRGSRIALEDLLAAVAVRVAANRRQ